MLSNKSILVSCIQKLLTYFSSVIDLLFNSVHCVLYLTLSFKAISWYNYINDSIH